MANADSELELETTLAIIKPDAVSAGKDQDITNLIEAHGFTIVRKRRVCLTPEQTSEFYSDHYDKPFYRSLISFMSSGPIIVLVLAKAGAVAAWRNLIGPTDSKAARLNEPNSIRACFGVDEQSNAVHGSDSISSSKREIRFFFPDCILEASLAGQDSQDYLKKYVNPTLVQGLTALCKVKPEEPLIWLSDWLLKNNPNTPKTVA